mmetsp:Transcript_26953/g.37854  ORF Transcript_26953/g.37854 Transcript_26953/m.37854 type:complete len:178 (-) Transcript_26953:148-681(-)
MPKNKGKGGKSKRKGKNKNREGEKRELILKEEGQEYAKVLKVLGNCRVQCECFDGKERQCHVRGKFRKKVWINKDDVILIGLRDYQDDKADVIHKYSMDEARQLRNMGHIPDRALMDSELLDEDGAEDFFDPVAMDDDEFSDEEVSETGDDDGFEDGDEDDEDEDDSEDYDDELDDL